MKDEKKTSRSPELEGEEKREHGKNRDHGHDREKNREHGRDKSREHSWGRGFGRRHPGEVTGKYQLKDPKNFLEVQNLVVEYSSDKKIVQAVNGISFSLKKGETLGLVGETGAGKTTIAKAIMRILPDPPAKVKDGAVFVGGRDLMQMPEHKMLKIRGAEIAMIFQDPMTALNPLMSVGDQIMEVVQIHNHYTREEALEHTCKMLEMVGIPRSRSVEYPHQFSGGMKQRVVIAMALACNPELLLADEPTTALDVTIQAQVLDMIRDLRDRLNTSMVLITHDLGVVAETCDKVAVIYAGKIVEYGSKEDIFRHPTHPYTLGLFGSLPKLDDDSKRLSPIHGLPPDPTNLPEGCAFHPRCPLTKKTAAHKSPVQDEEAKGKRAHICPVCFEGEPPLREITPGHFVACHLCGNGKEAE